MPIKNSEVSTLKTPSFIRGFLKLIFHLKTMRIRKKEISRLIVLEESLETFKIEYKRAEKNGENDKIKIFNVALFSLIVDYDVSVLKFMILFQMDAWNKQFLGRQLAVLLYESTDDFLKLLGKDFRTLINDLPSKEILIDELNNITKELNTFKSKNKLFLQEIRNYCGAHRDKNAYKQLMAINKIDTDELFELTAEFMIPVTKMTSYYARVMSSMVKKIKAHNKS